MKKHLYIGIIIAVAACYYTFQDVSFHDLGLALASMHLKPLIPALIFYILFYYIRVVRWRYLISSIKDVPNNRLVSPMMIGFMANMLPARVGELIRAYLLGKRENIPFPSSFATIAVERLFDLILVIVMFGGLIFFQPDLMSHHGPLGDPEVINKMKMFGWGSLIVVILLILFSYLLIHKQHVVFSWIEFFCRPFPEILKTKILNFTHSFTDGLMVLKDFKTTCVISILSGLLWIVSLLSYYPFYFAFDIEYLPFSSLMVVFVLICLFITIFPTPAFIGSFQAACMVGLHNLYGVPEAVAASFGIVTWAFFMIFTFIGGTYYLFKDNISIMDLRPKLSEPDLESTKQGS